MKDETKERKRKTKEEKKKKKKERKKEKKKSIADSLVLGMIQFIT